MNRSLALLGVIVWISVAGAAGSQAYRMAENDGVVLYLSLAPEIAYDDTTRYRKRSATPMPDESIVTGPVSSKPQIAYVLAAFPPDATPDLTVASFGVRMSPGVRIVRYGVSPNALQMATRDWPLSGEGMMIGLLEPADTSHVVELGWMAIVASKKGRLELTPHPDPRMAARVVSHQPPEQVPAAALGRLGFGEPGWAPVPKRPGPTLGATCIRDSLCLMLTREEAQFYQSRHGRRLGPVVFLGESAPCTGDALCRIEAPMGACCMPDQSCRVLTHKMCVEAGGAYREDDLPCDPNPCGGIPESGTEKEGSR